MRLRACGATTLAIVAGIALPGCSSSRSGGSPASAPGPSAARSSAAAPPTRVAADYGDNGGTVTVAVGSQLTVSLGSTYWSFAPPAPDGPLRGSPAMVRSGSGGRTVPGSGQGTVVETFRALARGTATVTATRRSCGEAMRCTGGQGDYRLTVVVR